MYIINDGGADFTLLPTLFWLSIEWDLNSLDIPLSSLCNYALGMKIGVKFVLMGAHPCTHFPIKLNHIPDFFDARNEPFVFEHCPTVYRYEFFFWSASICIWLCILFSSFSKTGVRGGGGTGLEKNRGIDDEISCYMFNDTIAAIEILFKERKTALLLRNEIVPGIRIQRLICGSVFSGLTKEDQTISFDFFQIR